MSRIWRPHCRNSSRRLAAAAAIGSYSTLSLLVFSEPLHADELSDLRAQIKAMRAASIAIEKRLAKLEKEKAAKPVLLPVKAPPPPISPGGDPRAQGLVTSSYPGFIDVPGTNTSIKLGGFVKADAVYDIRGGGIGGVGSDFREIPLAGTSVANRAGDFQFTARQTQIDFYSITPTNYGDVKTFVNFDFYAMPGGPLGVAGNGYEGNNYTPRLLQAFATVGHAFGGSILVGEAFSTFMDLDSYGETLDLNGPVGVAYAKQPQLRYTRALGQGNTLYASIEAPFGEFEGIDQRPVYNLGGAVSANEMDPFPDFVAKFTHDDTWGHFAISGVARYIKVNTGANESVLGGTVPNIDLGSGNSTGAGIVNRVAGDVPGRLAGGALVGVVLKTGGLDTVNAQMLGGPGIGRYLYGEDDSHQSTAALVNFDSLGVAHDIRPTTAFGAQVAYQHYWTTTVRSDFVAGYAHYFDEFPDNPTASLRDIASAHANLIYSPISGVDLGVEFMYGFNRVLEAPVGAADYGKASRVLTSAKVGF